MKPYLFIGGTADRQRLETDGQDLVFLPRSRNQPICRRQRDSPSRLDPGGNECDTYRKIRWHADSREIEVYALSVLTNFEVLTIVFDSYAKVPR